MKILLLGATGLVGKNVMAQALNNPDVTSVIAPTRRALAAHPKLTNPVFDRLEASLSGGIERGVDGVICALGTTIRKAGSKDHFREVDYELPLRFARGTHQLGVATFVLVSASVASVDSAMFYPRTKGEVERDIERVGFTSLTIVRPSLIGGERDERRIGEEFAIRVLTVLAPILPRKLHINPASRIAEACLSAVIAARPGLHIRDAESLVSA